MVLKPDIEDVKIIGFYLSKIILAIGASMVLPLVLSFSLREYSPCADFAIGIEIALLIGLALHRICLTNRDLRWMHGMIVVSLSWICAMFLAAVPLYLSGHWHSYLDGCFDTMSGFATTGLSLAQDLDHLSYGHNLWRHLIMFIGGQGIVIVALSFFVKGFSGSFKMYVGEARDERILPKRHTFKPFYMAGQHCFPALGHNCAGHNRDNQRHAAIQRHLPWRLHLYGRIRYRRLRTAGAEYHVLSQRCV